MSLFSLEAEQFTIASAIGNQALFPELAALVSVEQFSIEAHRKLWDTLDVMFRAGDTIDRVTVAQRLADNNKLDLIGGLGYLVDLERNMPALANPGVYAEIVARKALIRDAMREALKFTDAAENGEPTEDLAIIAEKMLQTLSGARKDPGGWFTTGNVLEGSQDVWNPQRGGNGIASAWPTYTRMLTGYHPGELVILGARPSMGKTAMMLQDAVHVASCGHRVAILSFEMRKEALVQRILCAQGRVDYQRFRSGYCSMDEHYRIKAAMEELWDLPLYIRDVGARTPMLMRAEVRKLASRVGAPRLLCVDYIQRMSAGGRTENRNAELTEISGACKELAMEMGATAVVLSQLSRECEKEKRKPHIGDLRESGAIEQDADVVALLHREERYHPERQDLKGQAELIVAKQRNGPLGTVDLTWLGEWQRFEECAHV